MSVHLYYIDSESKLQEVNKSNIEKYDVSKFKKFINKKLPKY